MKINKKTDIWYWKKIKENELEFPIYEFWNQDKSEYYSICIFSQMLDCIEEPTKEAREKYIKIYGYRGGKHEDK